MCSKDEFCLQVGFKSTGRICVQPGCGGRLKDSILDWEDALPEPELQAAEQHASQADLAICLGTSLQIIPACNLPLRTKRAGTTRYMLACDASRAVAQMSRASLVLFARIITGPASQR